MTLFSKIETFVIKNTGAGRDFLGSDAVPLRQFGLAFRASTFLSVNAGGGGRGSNGIAKGKEALSSERWSLKENPCEGKGDSFRLQMHTVQAH